MDSQQHTQYSHDSVPARVNVTRRHHPLQGQTLDVVSCGQTRVVVRLDDGTSMRMPRSWTDIDGEPLVAGADRIFTADALRSLLTLVDALSARDRRQP